MYIYQKDFCLPILIVMRYFYCILLCLKLNVSIFMMFKFLYTCTMCADVQHPGKVRRAFQETVDRVSSLWNWRHLKKHRGICEHWCFFHMSCCCVLFYSFCRAMCPLRLVDDEWRNWLFQQRTSPSNALQVAAAGCWLGVVSDMLKLLRHIEIK